MLAKLMEIAGVASVPPIPLFNPHTVIEKGFVIDTSTGEVIGNHIDPTEGAFGGGRPIWVYDRSIRFAHLFNPANIPRQYRSPILDIFEKLETQWKSRKEKYLPRKYFLSQALTLRLICAKRDIPCAWKTKAVIRDKKRYKRQSAIFDELWAFAKL